MGLADFDSIFLSVIQNPFLQFIDNCTIGGTFHFSLDRDFLGYVYYRDLNSGSLNLMAYNLLLAHNHSDYTHPNKC